MTGSTVPAPGPEAVESPLEGVDSGTDVSPAGGQNAAAESSAAPEVPVRGTVAPQRPGLELLLVLGVSLGQSAVYSILSLVNKLTYQVPLNQQTTPMNSSVTPDRPWLDLLYQIAGIVFPVVPALLALYLLHLAGQRREIGFDIRRPWFDLGRGFALVAAIGIPGLGLYYLAWVFGFNTAISPANLAAQWWTVPAYVLLAAMNGVLEEVVMLGFFFNRARALGWHIAVAVVVSALVRGSYHLYQGWGSFVGNLLMGLAFGWLYLRWKRVGPLVVAHTLLDVFSFVGAALLAAFVPWL